MIVADASAVVALLLGDVSGAPLADRMSAEHQWSAPHVLDAEVVSALRGLERSGQYTKAHIVGALGELADLPVVRFPLAGMVREIWALRHNFTIYDAAYIALAEALDCPLVTCDVKLRRGHNAAVEFFG